MRLDETKMQIKMGEQEMNIRMLAEKSGDKQSPALKQEKAVPGW